MQARIGKHTSGKPNGPDAGDCSIVRRTSVAFNLAGGIGPPFSSCLAIATACVTTCDSLSVETRVPPICEDGQVPHSEIEKYSRPFGYLDAAFVAFLICYTVGLMYFFVMCEQTCAT